MLSLFEANRAMEERGKKGGMVHLCDTWGFEVILTLLTKVAAIHVGFTLISLQGPSF